MAPEQCGGERRLIGPAADAWGLGATLFHAVSGEKPFPRGSGGDGPERFPQLAEEPLPLPPRLPADLRQLIAELLDSRSRCSAQAAARWSSGCSP